MSVYEITYDYCSRDGLSWDENIRERFEGSWGELQDYIRELRYNGCFNITASAVGEEV